MRAQRSDLDLFGQGIQDALAGRETEEAEAACINVASVLTLVAQGATENKWSR